MATTPKAGLRYPIASDAPTVDTYIKNLATDVDTKVIIPVGSQAARDALGTTGNLTVFRTDTGDYESNYGGSWGWVAGPLVQGKMWRTAGISATLTGTAVTVAMDASRVAGGMTFDNANDALVLNRSGYYDLRGRGYATGSTGYSSSYRIVRVRAATADREIVISTVGRKVDATDETVLAIDTLPLQTGDKLFLRVIQNGGAYYGIDEVNGVYLSARYVGPLSGATPV